MTDLWILYLIPVYFIDKLGPLSMIIAGFLVEKHYVGRMSVFLNTIAINIFAYSKMPYLTQYDIWYCNIGLLVGLIALVSYMFEESLPSWYYLITFVYSSVVTGAYILFR